MQNIRAPRQLTLIELSAFLAVTLYGMVWAGIAGADDRHRPTVRSTTEWDVSQRCAARAKLLWNVLTAGDKQAIKAFMESHPYVTAQLPEAISALEDGRISQAQQIVQEYYGVDGRLAANVATLMMYANGVESACPTDAEINPSSRGSDREGK